MIYVYLDINYARKYPNLTYVGSIKGDNVVFNRSISAKSKKAALDYLSSCGTKHGGVFPYILKDKSRVLTWEELAVLSEIK